jgi:opacity protein-like surface antigen
MIRQNIGIWLAASALGALPVGGVLAADLPVKAKPIVAATFDWSGVYIGAHAGYGGGMKDWKPGGFAQADFVARGALVGGQIGINKQLGSFVLGAELSGSWADINGRSHIDIVFPGTAVTLDSASKIDGLVTFAGRAGIAADRWFVFAKAGLTAAHEKHSGSLVIAAPAPAVGALVATASETRYAPMLGFGTEYALSGNWSVFGEYNYHYFGDRNVPFRATSTVAGTFPVSEGIDQSIHVAKVGVNYRWGGVAVDPSYAPVRPAPGNNWSGGYIGVQGGYAWGTKQWPTDVVGLPVKYDTDGWLAGGTIGANAQAGIFVFGVEAEILATGSRAARR